VSCARAKVDYLCVSARHIRVTHVAPAGGATVAAPKGDALASPSASPHLPVVGAGNPLPCQAKRADSSIRRINSCRESLVHMAFEKIISLQYRHQDLPLGPSDMFFRGQILLNTILRRGGGACTALAFDGEEGTAG
jgi:hypothetical protein